MQTNGAVSHDRETTCSYRGVIQECTAERHGTRVAYDTYHCRCPDARAQSTRARKARAARQLAGGHGLVPAVGTVRRLRALARAGWTLQLLGDELGCTWQRIRHLRDARTDHVNITTHIAVAGLYARLADRCGPSNRARQHAERQGWLGPLWWDADTIDDPTHNPQASLFDSPDIDTVAVERFLAGDSTIRLTRDERLHAYRSLTARGLCKSQIASSLRLSGAAVNQLAEAAS